MVAFLVMGRGNRASHNKGGPFGRSTGIKAIDLLMALREFFREFEARARISATKALTAFLSG
jgi:hypothetical protein